MRQPVHEQASGIRCESTGFGNSVDTPTLTATGSDLLLTRVDSHGVMHVTEVNDDGGCFAPGGTFVGNPNSLSPGLSTAISGQTSWAGPTLLAPNTPFSSTL